jgi:hypothetical protein
MKVCIFTIVIVFVFSTLSFAQSNKDSIKLFPVFVKGKYGYINTNGEMVIKPQFDKAHKFHSGLALVEIEAKNISNTPGRFDYILGKQGYIDQTGKFIIEAGKYNLANDFSEGLAGVGINNCKKKYCHGYIDTTGKLVIQPLFQTVGEFHQGTADVRMLDDKWGVIDKKGNFIIPPIYDGTLPFYEGIGIGLKINNKQKSPFEQKLSDFEAAFYDRNGKILARPKYLVFGWFTEGLVSIITEKGTGFIDKLGKIIIEPKFEKVFGFSEGLCPVQVNKKWGYIDKTGMTIIEPQFKQAFIFSDGIAKVLIDGKFGFIDKTGKVTIEPQSWDVSDFEDGLAFVRQNSTSGYIDKTGNFIWKSEDE